MKILIIEDSDRLRRSLGEGLTHAGHAIDLAADGLDGLEFLKTFEYDVVLLDLMLPRMDGLQVLGWLGQQRKDPHVLILSAKDRLEDRIRGLRLGADDYLVKPFSFEELCARLLALERRRLRVKNPILRIGPLSIDTARREVSRGGQMVHLSPSEYSLLSFLALRTEQPFSQRVLIEQLYPSDTEVSSNVIEGLVSGLRKKIERPGERQILRTRRGLGYVIDPR